MSEVHPSLSGRLLKVMGIVGPFVGLGFIILVFFLYDVLPDGSLEKFDRIFSVNNLKLISTQTTIVAIGALGMTMIIISGGIDLSPGSVIALVTVVIAVCIRGVSIGDFSLPPMSPLLAVPIGVATGALVGFVNGNLITRLKIVPFIVTLGMMSVARGLAKLFSGEQKVNVPESWVSNLLQTNYNTPFWDLPSGVFVLIVLSILLWLVLKYTVFGRYVFAIGSNEQTATLCGIRVNRQKIYIYTLAGVFVGIAAVMEFSTLNSGDPSTAVAKEFDIIAAVVIGGGSLSGGKGSVLGTLIGAFIIGILRNGCVLYDISNTVQEIVIGAIIVSAAAIDQLQQRRRG